MLQAWFPGIQGGPALADLLTGERWMLDNLQALLAQGRHPAAARLAGVAVDLDHDAGHFGGCGVMFSSILHPL